MRKIILPILMSFIFYNLQSQEIISINPDNAKQGDEISLTISGGNTHFYQATYTSVWLSQASSTIYPDYRQANSNTLLTAHFDFSIYSKKGEYTVNIYNSIDGKLELENAFTLEPYSLDTLLISQGKEQTNQNQGVSFEIVGYNTNFQQASNTIWAKKDDYIVQSEKFYVYNNNYIYTKMFFPKNSPTGEYDLFVYNPIDDTLCLKEQINVLPYIEPTIRYISPSNGRQDEAIYLSISGSNTNFSQSSNTVFLKQGSSTIKPAYTQTYSDGYIRSKFHLTRDYPTGLYDIYVYNPTDELIIKENAFTLLPYLNPRIESITPDHANKGDNIELTITGKDVNFYQGTSMLIFAQESSSTENFIYPENIKTQSKNTLKAEFKFKNTYNKGSYDVLLYTPPYNGFIHLQDGFYLYENPTPPEIISISPDNALTNEEITLIITGENTNFTQGTNSISLEQNDYIILPKNTKTLSGDVIKADFKFKDNDYLGLYTLNIYNDFDGNISFKDCFSLNTRTSINNNEFNKILISPNPANDKFRIENIPYNCKIEIISLEGTVLKSLNNKNNSYLNISVPGLKGVFIIKISSKDVILTTQKILIY